MKSPNALLLAAFSTATFWPMVANALVFSNKQGLNISTVFVERPDVDDPSKNVTMPVTMGVSPNSLKYNGTDGLAQKRWEGGPSRENPNFALNERDMQEAMRCLEEEFCHKQDIAPSATISCAVGDMMAYACNHVSLIGTGIQRTAMGLFLDFDTEYVGKNPCSLNEMRDKWEELRREKRVDLGWWYAPEWSKLYGWDRTGAEVCGNLVDAMTQFKMTCEGCECVRWQD